LISINWITGGKVSENWAYGNNCRNLIRNLPEFKHYTDQINNKYDFIVYFDPLLFYKNRKRFPKSKHIVRFGGLRPFKILEENFHAYPKDLLNEADYCVSVNEYMTRYANNYAVIPNGVDLTKFYPKEKPKNFVVGFAGNIQNDEQIKWKGFDLVEKATRNKYILIVAKRGKDEIPNSQMCEKFFNRISCLVLPSHSEGCSNTITEALACGVPVITTQGIHYHSQLEYCKEILFCKREVKDIEFQLSVLEKCPELKETLSTNGRRFVEENQDIITIAYQWKRIFERLC
jgi:glycosyltransferase involved in cell wall biosynthesis